MSTCTQWTVQGADGEVILGNAHVPDGEPVGVAIIAHGFKGYKDYGMFPRIAETMCEAGFIAHRFNFSHSGMTNNIDTFERVDLFERDTWNKQVFDCRAVVSAVADGQLDGAGLPYILFGHSRGGVSVLLTAGRLAEDSAFPQPVGIVTASAPCQCMNLPPEAADQLLKDGYIVSPSSRTGQELRIDKAALVEQLDDPAGHDVLALVGRITCPLLVIHGEDDPTVPADAAQQIASAAQREATVLRIAGGDHVYNTPNPLPEDAPSSSQFQQLLDATVSFAKERCAQASPST